MEAVFYKAQEMLSYSTNGLFSLVLLHIRQCHLLLYITLTFLNKLKFTPEGHSILGYPGYSCRILKGPMNLKDVFT